MVTTQETTRDKVLSSRSKNFIWGLLFVLMGACLLQQYYKQHQMRIVIRHLANTQDNLAMVVKENQVDLQKISRVTIEQENIWVFNQAKYLVQLANYVLEFERNISESLVLLRAADQQLQLLPNTKVATIRSLLAKVMVDLVQQKKENLDTAGLLYRLTALHKQVNELPITLDQFPNFSTSAPTSTESTMQDWRLALVESLERWRHLIVVRHNTQSKPVALLPEDRRYAQESLHLFLIQAEWAVLRGNTRLYRVTLEQAQDFLLQNFPGDAPSSMTIAATLQNLEQVNIKPKKTDLNRLLQLFAES